MANNNNSRHFLEKFFSLDAEKLENQKLMVSITEN
jgi:hypothetical protein